MKPRISPAEPSSSRRKSRSVCSGRYAVLGTEDVLKRAVGHIRSLDDLGECGTAVAFLKEEPHTDAQNAALCQKARTGESNIGLLSLFGVYTKV